MVTSLTDDSEEDDEPFSYSFSGLTASDDLNSDNDDSKTSPPVIKLRISSTVNTTDKVVSTYRNWVGPTVGKPTGDRGCYREAHIMKTCPFGFEHRLKICWTECPLSNPIQCGVECLKQSDDCTSELFTKFVPTANFALSLAVVNVFGEFKKWSKTVQRGVKCVRTMFATVRAIVMYIREMKVSDPQTSQEKLLLALYQTSYVTIDLPTSIAMCVGQSYPDALDDTYGVIVNDLLKSGKSDNGTSLKAKEYTRKVFDKGFMTFAVVFFAFDVTRIANVFAEWIQPICGPTQLIGEIDDGTEPDTLGLKAVGKAFKGSSITWTRVGDGAVTVNFASVDTKDVTVNIMSAGDKIDEVDIAAGKNVTWKSNITALGGKTLYLDR
ncbi:hypothetical protein BBJ29_008009 [Phytophthora kernoviae]|uniref:Uncharacterized protein n=1 Tax=Phytophthora kernoviae TaxID=325452 RepID=A0A3F2RE47_9STRA|nr:hypothetical protein BBJ29_008009 [Phytophthora kernoviae]RLN54534.1 hypothetical protein BBP00_00008901 [Phytophthora kernoviae]